MRFVVAGSVSSSKVTLDALVRHGTGVAGVLALDPAFSSNVSGYVDLAVAARAYGIPYVAFRHVNSPEVLAALRCWEPDYLFVVGLSQLVSEEVMECASEFCIGFHPTLLPDGRGRAPLAWLILERGPAAATLFRMTAEADAGPILAQVPYDVRDTDCAADVLARMEGALALALDDAIPKLVTGDFSLREQLDRNASWYGRRTPGDGCIRWNNTAEEICALVRATSRPHPGAYTFHHDVKVTIWRASVEQSLRVKGVVGRVVMTERNQVVVQTGRGLLRIEEYRIDEAGAHPRTDLTVGSLLGYSTENELFDLRRRVAVLEELVRKEQ